MIKVVYWRKTLFQKVDKVLDIKCYVFVLYN